MTEFDADFATTAQWAEYYRSLGWPVVPALQPGEGKQGQWKRPAVAWKAYQAGVPEDVWADWYGPTGKYLTRQNIGVLTGKAVFVLDLDLYKSPSAAQWWAGVLAVNNSSMELETASQRTGGGGRQLFFRAPPGWVPPTNKTPLGIDIRGMGGFAMLPPSKHESGQNYVWEDGLEPQDVGIMEAPVWLCAAIDKLVEEYGGAAPAIGAAASPTTSPSQSVSPFGTLQDGREAFAARHAWGWVVNLYREAPQKPFGGPLQAEIAAAFAAYVAKVKTRLVDPAATKEELLEREGRGLTFYAVKFSNAMDQWGDKVAEHAKLPPPPREPVVLRSQNINIDPQTGEILNEPLKLSKAPMAARIVKDEKVTVIPPAKSGDGASEDGEGGPPARNAGFLMTQKGGIIGCLYNAALAIRTDSAFARRIRLNTLSGRIMFATDEGEKVMQDKDVIEITCYLQATYSPSIGLQTVHEALAAVAAENAFDPLRDYIDGLQWDGVSRISSWLEDFCGAVAETNDQRKFVSAAGRAWFISAVARALTPAAKADGVLILQGAQGIGKSTVASILGGEWFTDEMPNLASKDAALQLHGNWIIELGELAAMSRSDLESTKGFLARTIDKYRPPYGRITVEQPRRCVFIGTTNSLTFLKDETGNRRFWPIECNSIDVESLRSLRDQLFAEAAAAYRAGEKWWLEDEALRIATREQEIRTDNDDELAGEVLSIANLKPEGICIAEIMKRMDLLNPQPRSTHLRIGSILRKEGWVIRGFTRPSEGFGTQKKYVLVNKRDDDGND